MTSLFLESSDNEKIKTVYGNYGLWAWLRYWYLDTANIVNLYLIDKGYYDYDYEKIKKPVLFEKTVKSEQEVSAMMQKFGIGKTRVLSAEELQAIAMRELKDKS